MIGNVWIFGMNELTIGLLFIKKLFFSDHKIFGSFGLPLTPKLREINTFEL